MVTYDTGHCLGLAPGVLFRLEIGLAIVDDGERTFRLPGRSFTEALANIASPEPEEPSSRVRSILEAHPTIFVPLPAHDARKSVRDREV